MSTNPFLPGRRLRLAAAALALLAALPAAATRHEYDVTYTIGFDPDAGTAQIAIEVEPSKARVGAVELEMPEDRYTRVRGDGRIERDGDTVVWRPLRDKPS